MKNKIIDFIMGTLQFHYIHDWELESAKNFCKLVLDGEGIEYQEEDFKNFSLMGSVDRNAIGVVNRYAHMYRDIYNMSDKEKAEEMNKVLLSCKQILNFSHSLDDLFNDKSAEIEPQQEITIKPGDSIQFSNGAASNLSAEKLAHLMEVTFPEEQEEKPFTILFNANVPKEVQEEVKRRVSSIYEEVKSEMESGLGR